MPSYHLLLNFTMWLFLGKNNVPLPFKVFLAGLRIKLVRQINRRKLNKSLMTLIHPVYTGDTQEKTEKLHEMAKDITLNIIFS